jgi:hypothetical protein
MKKSEITRQWLDNVGFIGIENNPPLRTTSDENGPTLFENRPTTSGLDHIRRSENG